MVSKATRKSDEFKNCIKMLKKFGGDLHTIRSVSHIFVADNRCLFKAIVRHPEQNVYIEQNFSLIVNREKESGSLTFKLRVRGHTGVNSYTIYGCPLIYYMKTRAAIYPDVISVPKFHSHYVYVKNLEAILDCLRYLETERSE